MADPEGRGFTPAVQPRKPGPSAPESALSGRSPIFMRQLLFRRQRPDEPNIQASLRAPPSRVFRNRGAELFVESKCLLRKLLRPESLRQVTHCLTHIRQRLTEPALQIMLDSRRRDGFVLDHRAHTFLGINRG